MTTTDTDKSCLGDVPLSPQGTVSEQVKKLADWGRWEPTAGRSLKKCSRATMRCKGMCHNLSAEAGVSLYVREKFLRADP